MASAFESLYPIARGQETYYSLSEAKQKLFNTTAGPTLLTWISLLSIQILDASKEEQQILKRQFPTECRETFLLISESDLTRLFYYGDRDPFPCNWFQIGSLDVRIPHAPPDVLPSDTNASGATKDYHCSRNDDLTLCAELASGPRMRQQPRQILASSEDTGCASEFPPVQARQAPSLLGDNATELFSPQRCRIGELAQLSAQTTKRASAVFPTNSATLPKQLSDERGRQTLARPASSQLVETCDEGQFAKRLRKDKVTAFVSPQRDRIVQYQNCSRVGTENLTHPASAEVIPVAFASTSGLSISQPVETSNEGQTSTIASEPPNHQGAPKEAQNSSEAARGQTESFSQPRDFQEGVVGVEVCDAEPESNNSVVDQGGSKERKKTRVLQESEMSTELVSHIRELKNFYSQGINLNRGGSSLQDSTVNKMIERVSSFLWYVKKVKRIEPALALCGDAHAVQDFIRFASEERKIKAITCSRYISAFFNVIRFLNASPESSSVTDRSMEQLRALQRQLESENRKQRLFEQATKPFVDRKVVYPEILELCRELKWQLEELRGLERARCAMGLCLLLIYCGANPGRAKEFYTLRIFSGQSTEECRDQNFICFGEDGSVVLLECDYKTKYAYGPNRTDLTQLPFLTHYINLYRQKFRPQLLMGNAHDYFFVAKNGTPFSASSYSNYISALFEKHFSVKLTTNDLRKCVVDYFLSLPASGDHALRESLATVMKHSLRTQKRHYDERPLSEKKVRAISFLGDMTSRAIDEDAVEVVSDEDEDGYLEVRPSNGELVAMVAADSTSTEPKVFVAKVLRYTEDHKTVFLADFEEVEPCKFKLNAGKSYRESAKSIIYPVDIVYLQASGVYELRTPKSDIHKQVRRPPSK